MSNIVTGLAQYVGANVAGLKWSLAYAADVNVFEGNLPPNPNRAVAVYPNGGTGADSGLPYDSPGIQVIVRGDEDPAWALDMWYAVYNVVQGLSNVTLPDGTYLVSCLAVQSGPVHIGKDESGRFQYGMNLECEIKNPTVKRPA